MTDYYIIHEHGKGLGNCIQPFDFATLMDDACRCPEGNVSVSSCSCVECGNDRRANCEHIRTHTDPYGYTECRDCGASHASKTNPLTKCYLDCTVSSYGLCNCR